MHGMCLWRWGGVWESSWGCWREQEDGVERSKPAQKKGRDYKPIIRVISDQIGLNY